MSRRETFAEENIIEYDLPDGTAILIESDRNEVMMRSVSRSGIAKPDKNFDNALDSISSTLRVLVNRLKEAYSDEFEVSFGIKPLASTGSFIVTQGTDTANFNIKLIWKRP